jgi:hypothetical protein
MSNHPHSGFGRVCATAWDLIIQDWIFIGKNTPGLHGVSSDVVPKIEFGLEGWLFFGDI